MPGLKDTVKQVVGRAAELVFPGIAREIDETRNPSNAPRLKRAILHARLQRAKARGDQAAADETVEKALAAFWKGGSGDVFHRRHVETRFNLFLKIHAHLIDQLTALIAESGNKINRLVEIGCGDGNVLAYCVERLPSIREAVGLDINAAVIKTNTAARAADKRLSFVAAEAGDWLLANPKPGTVVLANGGVLEYFSARNFDRLLSALSAHPPAALVLIEPVAPDHDLANDTSSHVFGHEGSFSHNHRYRLERAGFTVAAEQEIRHGKVRWMLMIGLLE